MNKCKKRQRQEKYVQIRSENGEGDREMKGVINKGIDNKGKR